MNKETIFITAQQADLDALNITVAMRMKLSDWDLLAALFGNRDLMGISIPMHDAQRVCAVVQGFTQEAVDEKSTLQSLKLNTGRGYDILAAIEAEFGFAIPTGNWNSPDVVNAGSTVADLTALVTRLSPVPVAVAAPARKPLTVEAVKHAATLIATANGSVTNLETKEVLRTLGFDARQADVSRLMGDVYDGGGWKAETLPNTNWRTYTIAVDDATDDDVAANLDGHINDDDNAASDAVADPDLMNMTARQIVDHVSAKFGQTIQIGLKSKRAIINKALRIINDAAGAVVAATAVADTPVPASPAKVGPVEVTDATYDELVIKSTKPVVLDLWADWCAPCRLIAPAIEELAAEYAGRVIVAKLNVDANPATAQRLGIRSIPTVLFVNDGMVVDRAVGAVPKKVLVDKIETLLVAQPV